MKSMLNVGRILHATTAEGPHLRTAIWVQGCSIRCAGCINPHLFDSRAGTFMEPEEIIAAAVEHSVEGLTLIGGEPFDQATAVADLAELAQQAGLGVITFTGYSLESLQAREDDSPRLIKATDLLIDGPYESEKPETERALVGSENQRFLYLSERYASYDPVTASNKIEVRIHPDGSIDMGGFLNREQLDHFASATGVQRRYKR